MRPFDSKPPPALPFILLLSASLVLVTGGPAMAAEPATTRIPTDRLLSDDEMISFLEAGGGPVLEEVRKRYAADQEDGLVALADYFKEVFSQRYYFDWKKMDARFDAYRRNFPSMRGGHEQNKNIHMDLYPARARWKLPYRNLKGDAVSAYELRHLARQHKVLDMAFMHHYEDGNPVYVDYFTEQVNSLNVAFVDGEYEDDAGGNGVYESFRAGYRVMNWLQIHAFYLGSEQYGREDQLELVRTLLREGASLHARNTRFRYGNHQTRGAVALAMISILLQDYAGTDTWYRDAMDILGEHLDREVNADGFQFERSVHYHIGDIYNYFRVLQLAQLNGFPVPESWRRKLKAMFDAAIVLARPDRRLPVLQDDTDRPWAEYNEMGDFMLLGSILFDDPAINYFAGESVSSSVYWLLRDEQIEALAHLDRRRPALQSAELPATGYYVMREGWQKNGYHMVITAGLSEHKPDHQHGDMLGLIAHANQQDILPNYQVRYFLDDFEYFKNSFVKNVAIVDNIPHGVGWKSNRGGSGFGKWEKLPQPRVISWIKRDRWDFFAGSHDGYDDRGVTFHRKVLFLKGLGWIVRDIFDSSTGDHDFQQIWQGHYSAERSDNHHRSVFADSSGLEILQLGDQADAWSATVRRGKGNLVYTRRAETAAFTTLLYPFESFSSRIPDAFFAEKTMTVNGWTMRVRGDSDIAVGELATDAALVLENAGNFILVGATRLSFGQETLTASETTDFSLEPDQSGSTSLTHLGHLPVTVKGGNAWLSLPGNDRPVANLEQFQPGSSISLHR